MVTAGDAMSPGLTKPGLNPAVQRFMAKNGPPPPPKRKEYKYNESESMISYPKDITQSVLLKNMNMRMAVTPPGHKQPPINPPDVCGRLKSDVTSGFERIYERSYY